MFFAILWESLVNGQLNLVIKYVFYLIEFSTCLLMLFQLLNPTILYQQTCFRFDPCYPVLRDGVQNSSHDSLLRELQTFCSEFFARHHNTYCKLYLTKSQCSKQKCYLVKQDLDIILAPLSWVGLNKQPPWRWDCFQAVCIFAFW